MQQEPWSSNQQQQLQQQQNQPSRRRQQGESTVSTEVIPGDPLPTALCNGKAFSLPSATQEGHAVALVYDCAGGTRAVHYDVSASYSSSSSSGSRSSSGDSSGRGGEGGTARGHVSRRFHIQARTSTGPHQAALLHHRYPISKERLGFTGYDMVTGKRFTLPHCSEADGLIGPALLATSTGMYSIGGKDPVSHALRYHCLYYEWYEDPSNEHPLHHSGTFGSREWKVLPEIQVARRDAAAVELNGDLYLIGGYHWNRDRVRYTACKKTEVYDGTQWNFGPDLVYARQNPAVLAVGNVIVVLGGYGEHGQPVTAVEIWNTETDAFYVWGHWERARKDVSAVHWAGNRDEGEADAILIFCGGSSVVEKIAIDPTKWTAEALEPLLPRSRNDSDCDGISTTSSQELGDLMRGGRGRNVATLKTLIPPPPVRPNLPTAPTVAERCVELKQYISHMENLHDDYVKNMDQWTERITEVYDRARDQALDDLRYQGQLWIAETERLVTQARQEVDSVREIVEKQDFAGKWKKHSKVLYNGDWDHDYEDNIPSQLRCPITLTLMKDPVVAADGNTYDRQALEVWFASAPKKGKPLSPLTGAELPSEQYFPVHALRDLCRQFEEQQQQQEQQQEQEQHPLEEKQ